MEFLTALTRLDWPHLALTILGLTLVVIGIWPALAQEKKEPTSMTNITINGPAQIGDHNVQHNVNVNASAAYSSQGKVTQAVNPDGAHLTTLHFPITSGPWDSRAASAFEIKLSAPYQRYELVGFPGLKMNVLEQKNPAQGFLAFRTSTPPAADAVEFRFFGDQPMQVEQVGVSPLRKE